MSIAAINRDDSLTIGENLTTISSQCSTTWILASPLMGSFGEEPAFLQVLSGELLL